MCASGLLDDDGLRNFIYFVPLCTVVHDTHYIHHHTYDYMCMSTFIVVHLLHTHTHTRNEDKTHSMAIQNCILAHTTYSNEHVGHQALLFEMQGDHHHSFEKYVYTSMHELLDRAM